jgi:hypothetical protein
MLNGQSIHLCMYDSTYSSSTLRRAARSRGFKRPYESVTLRRTGEDAAEVRRFLLTKAGNLQLAGYPDPPCSLTPLILA